ncbi:histidinol-phosphatase [Paenibacillus motobuensis]|uniref:histidinol-phosphatase n=1 Tax=Paenibacillus TaxID=44249 RepID=UPI00203ACE01|nr:MULTISPECIES: histidinol-phosphatase [Paenibacillus]MCM3041838.1 histidinol-phosphatase [Paenibacillus lutimineralis]MCM3648942.1 histidinol-phosphatase [Paenibacillus motobuensis]
MKFDLHTHHFRCGHADGNISDYIEAGITAGLSVIGISDHTPYFGSKEDQAHPRIAMAKSAFAGYVEEVLSLKQKYAGKIDVLLGIESDYFPEHVEIYRDILSQYPFDYVIGSVHSVKDVSIFNKNRWKRLSPEEQIADKEAYYELIRNSARSGMFQILGHIDAMKGNYPAFSDIPATAAIDETLQVIADHQVAIEINTSGKTKLSGGWYPADSILERALHYGVEVTFGSDAHIPSRVGDEWDDVASRLREIGFDHWVYFKNKQKVSVPL